MKKFCALLLLLTVFSALVLPVSARTEKNVIVLNDCEEKFGNFTLDTRDPAEGGGCVCFSTRGASFANAYSFDPVDLTECDAIAFEIYVSDAALVSHFGQLCFEISSAGKCDEEELAWHLKNSLSTGLEEGWNTVYLSFTDGVPTGTIDLTRVNYFRIFALEIETAVCASDEIMFDNFRAAFTGGFDYSGMKIEGRSGDHKGENVVIAGMNEPDFSSRTPGGASDPSVTDPVSGDETDDPASSSLPLILGCSAAGVVLIAVVVVLLAKKKKK